MIKAREDYFRQIAQHFEDLSFEELGEETLTQVKRSLANYLAAQIYAAGQGNSQEVVDFIISLDPLGGKTSIWGEKARVNSPVAAFANAARVSSMELNDSTRGSAHPGLYIWSCLLAAYEEEAFPVEELIKATVFGFEVASRMALMSIDRVIELGLHNPGIVGGLGAVAALGYVRGLSKDELYRAFSITASLLPTCPFISFIDGADVKDFYGGWGVHLAFMALRAASMGLSGPEEILTGEKSLREIFKSSGISDVELGQPYYIDEMNIKEYPACFAVNPAVNAIKKILEVYPLDYAEIDRVHVVSYPYSVELSRGVDKLNPTSARLSLAHCSAYVLYRGDLTPGAFSRESLENPELKILRDKILVEMDEEYGYGNLARRAARVSIAMKDGQEYSSFYDAEDKIYISNEFLKARLLSLGEGILERDNILKLWELVMNLESCQSLEDILLIMKGVRRKV